jgi:hypothetical protein
VDASAQLALLTKAKLVFETETTFLSFPVLEPLAYPPARLHFADDGPHDERQRLADLSEFSRITNYIPRGVVARQDDEYLWHIYDEVLRTAEVAQGSMSAEEQARLDEVLALLYVRTPSGGRQDSPALAAYNGYRDAHIKALEEYKNRQLTAETSNDPKLTAQWATDEPAIRQAIAQILREWETAGSKAQIENAQQVEEAFAARAPSHQWTEWKDSFMAALDVQHDLNAVEYVPTIFSPYDVFDRGPWLRFTLTSEEIKHLNEQAPPELASILSVDSASDVERVSFEYRSVTLVRSWLRSAVFRAHFWRLGAGSEGLSDGANPPHGRCPSYVVALVFARNIVVQWRKPPPDVEPPPTEVEPPPDDVKPLPTDMEHTWWSWDLGSRHNRLVAVDGPSEPSPRAQPKIAIKRSAVASRPAPAQGFRIDAQADPFRSGEQPAPLRVAQSIRRPPAVATPALRSGRADAELPPPRQKTDLLLSGFPSQSVGALPNRGLDVVAPKASVKTEAPATDDVTILAFICKPLPRCPDPDPALKW